MSLMTHVMKEKRWHELLALKDKITELTNDPNKTPKKPDDETDPITPASPTDPEPLNRPLNEQSSPCWRKDLKRSG